MSVIVRDMPMPDICQNCSCFMHGTTADNLWALQVCRAKHKEIVEPKRTRDIAIDWNHTNRPEWCPLFEVKDWREI